MPNWSETDIQLEGYENYIKIATEYLKDSIKDNFLTPALSKDFDPKVHTFGYSCVEISEIILEPKSITIHGNGRWSGPYKYIKEFCKRFKLSGIYIDSESGCNFFNKMEFKDGEMTVEIDDKYFSQESISHYGIQYFIDEYSFIAEEDDWEDNNEDIINLFEKNNISLIELKELWQ